MNDDTYLTLAQRNYLTVHTAVIRIQQELDLGDSMFALRLLGNTTAVLQRLDPSMGELDEFLANPIPISDARWDVLFRTLIRWQMLELGYKPPAWTDAPPLKEPWFMWEIALSDRALLDEDWKERIRATTPIEFSSRNLWCDAARTFSTA